LVIEPGGDVDLCWSDPGFEIDLYVTTDLRTMTAIWMGLGTIVSERDKMELLGEKKVAETMQVWLGLSPFAKQKKFVAQHSQLALHVTGVHQAGCDCVR
jgi:hypothetical protein